MKRLDTLFLKLTLLLIGIAILFSCVYWLPLQAERAAVSAPDFAYLQYPVLLGMYATVLPFLFALVQSFNLLQNIENKSLFSTRSVKSLSNISLSALVIILLYVLGMIFLGFNSALHPGIALIGLAIIFVSAVIAVFGFILRGILKNVVALKEENNWVI